MNTTQRDHFRPPTKPTAIKCVSITKLTRHLVVDLTDGRMLYVPLAWFPVLEKATDSQLRSVQIIDGAWLRWDMLDEDIGLDGLMRVYGVEG